MSRKSLQTPQDRRSMLGFGSAAAKLRQQQRRPPEQKRLTFSANKSRIQMSGKRWSSQGSHQVKDSRPLSNRVYQKQMIEEILEFLNESGYPYSISPKVLSAPTTKEFLRVFEHLYGFLNTTFKMEKKFEEEVPRILKSLSYPFTISKSAMFAIGSLHTWPTLLGALHWMVELIKTVNTIDVEQILFPPSFEDEPICTQQEKIFFDYYSGTYKEFMLGRDDFSEGREQLQASIIKQAGCSEEDHECLVNDVASLEAELAELEAEGDPLEEAIRIRTSLEEKIEQDIMIIQNLQQDTEVLKQQYVQYQVQIKEEGVDYAELGDPSHQEEIKHKSSEVKVQLERLNAEKERLEQQNYEKEIRYSKLYDKVCTTINQYNDMVRELALNPIISQYVSKDSIALYIDHNLKDMSGLNDCKQRLKPSLIKLANQIADDRGRLEAQKITEMERYDHTKELCAEDESEIAELKSRLNNIEKDVDSHMELFEQEYQSSMLKLREQEEFLDNQQKEISKALQEEANELGVKRKETEIRQSKQMKEQEEYATALIDYCKRIVEHKQYIENRVKSIAKILADEVDAAKKQQEMIRKNEE